MDKNILNKISGFSVETVGLRKQRSKMQDSFLKNTGILDMRRFKDTDGDMVVDGLDCNRFNKNQHGIYTKTKNWMQGKGFKEDEKSLVEQELNKRKEPVVLRPIEAAKEKLVQSGFEREGKLSLSRPISKAVGYIFEEKEERQKYKAQDYKQKLEEAKKQLSLSELRKLKSGVKEGLISDKEMDRRIMYRNPVRIVQAPVKKKPMLIPKLRIITPLPMTSKKKPTGIAAYLKNTL